MASQYSEVIQKRCEVYIPAVTLEIHLLLTLQCEHRDDGKTVVRHVDTELYSCGVIVHVCD